MASNNLTEKYVKVQFGLTCVLIAIGLVILFNTFCFSFFEWFGVTSYYQDNWLATMKFVHMNEFQKDLSICATGKYIAGAHINENYNQVDCSLFVSKDDNIAARDLVSTIWEIKDTAEETMYGCLNPACRGPLELRLIYHIGSLVFYMTMLILVSFFSVGLAVHIQRFPHSYKSRLMEAIAFTFLVLFAIGGGILVASMNGELAIKTDPQSNWVKPNEGILPTLP